MTPPDKTPEQVVAFTLAEIRCGTLGHPDLRATIDNHDEDKAYAVLAALRAHGYVIRRAVQVDADDALLRAAVDTFADHAEQEAPDA